MCLCPDIEGSASFPTERRKVRLGLRTPGFSRVWPLWCQGKSRQVMLSTCFLEDEASVTLPPKKVMPQACLVLASTASRSGADCLFLYAGVDPKSSRRRAYSTNQIADREPFKKVPTASDPSAAMGKNPLRKAHVQDLCQISPEPQSWQADFQVSTGTVPCWRNTLAVIRTGCPGSPGIAFTCLRTTWDAIQVGSGSPYKSSQSSHPPCVCAWNKGGITLQAEPQPSWGKIPSRFQTRAWSCRLQHFCFKLWLT